MLRGVARNADGVLVPLIDRRLVRCVHRAGLVVLRARQRNDADRQNNKNSSHVLL